RPSLGGDRPTSTAAAPPKWGSFHPGQTRTSDSWRVHTSGYTTPQPLRTADSPVVVFRRGRAISFEKHGAIAIGNLAKLPHQDRRRHRQRRADHVADHGLEPELTSCAHERQPFGKPPALIELDVDHVESACQTLQIRERLDAFICGNRDGRPKAIE